MQVTGRLHEARCSQPATQAGSPPPEELLATLEPGPVAVLVVAVVLLLALTTVVGVPPVPVALEVPPVPPVTSVTLLPQAAKPKVLAPSASKIPKE
jgi:hypothetical protein